VEGFFGKRVVGKGGHQGPSGAIRIVLIGPPGAGKGTQSALLAEKLQIPHLSTGEILRAVCVKTEVGLQAARFMKRGQLVPDDMIQEIVFKELSSPVCEAGYILDGFPRTVPQAQEFDIWLQQSDGSLSLVLEFRVSEEILLKRLAGRGRSDDAREIIRKRMQQYDDLTRPLLEYYQAQGVLHTVHGDQGSAEDVFAKIEQILEDYSQ